jgi:uncharacterized membrane protein
MKFLIQYAIVLVVFFAVDLVWLGIIAKDLYAKYLGHLMAKSVNWPAAIIFYLIFILGLVVFVIQPTLTEGNLIKGLGMAALFGLVTYATYDLTNLATLRDWPIMITVIDLAWGTTLSTLVTLISVLILQRL